MKADLTRKTFDPRKHFARVLMQQGRVQLDADWNEQAAILLHSIRTLAADLIGPAGGPLSDCGFLISPLPARVEGQPVLNDFEIGLGHYYVDGILCEVDAEEISFKPVPAPGTTDHPANSSIGVIQLDTWTLDGLEFAKDQYLAVFDDVPPGHTPAFPRTVLQIVDLDAGKAQLTLRLPPGLSGTPTNPRLRRVITYLSQPDYPAPALPSSGDVQIFLDVWERHLTYIEDDSMREVALGGPDTATRSKVVWQVKTMPPPVNLQTTAPGNPCIPVPDLNRLLNPPTAGRLKVRAKQATAATDPCIISPTSSYQGPENQLYRVEIHRAGPSWNGLDAPAGGSAAATFKWSRENGSVVFPVISGGGSNLLTLASLGRDDRFSLSTGDWVEIEDDRSVLLNTPGPLLQVQSVDRASASVTLSGTPDPAIGAALASHPLLRRWDQKLGNPSEAGLTLGADNAALVREGVWLALEDGVEIFFTPSQGAANAYRTADYWLIPARTATGDVEWPKLTDLAGNLVLDSNGSSIPLARDPDGVTHHYAPVATLSIVLGQQVTIRSCLDRFQPAQPMA